MRVPGSIHALQGRQLWPSQSSGLVERFVTAGWQSCFSTYNAKSSLIIRSDEKRREEGHVGVVTGFNMLLPLHSFGSVTAKPLKVYIS